MRCIVIGHCQRCGHLTWAGPWPLCGYQEASVTLTHRGIEKVFNSVKCVEHKFPGSHKMHQGRSLPAAGLGWNFPINANFGTRHAVRILTQFISFFTFHFSSLWIFRLEKYVHIDHRVGNISPKGLKFGWRLIERRRPSIVAWVNRAQDNEERVAAYQPDGSVVQLRVWCLCRPSCQLIPRSTRLQIAGQPASRWSGQLTCLSNKINCGLLKAGAVNQLLLYREDTSRNNPILTLYIKLRWRSVWR